MPGESLYFSIIELPLVFFSLEVIFPSMLYIFDQAMGAAHLVRWSKYSFLCIAFSLSCIHLDFNIEIKITTKRQFFLFG